jgi:hypothetical protein
LDGIPLALELAAGWVRLLPVEQISRRLKENLDFLRGGSRTSLPRSQTLRGCLDWSYALLSPEEQELLQALSVFAGGWTLEAAEAVCADSRASSLDILTLLDQLIGKSLVVVEPEVEGELRYRLLEPVRQYAQEKLLLSGKLEILRDRHQVYFQGLAARAKPHLRTRQMVPWLRCLERELPNLRLALDWACSEESTMERLERGLRLAADLCFFWYEFIRQLEGILWLIRLLDLERLRRGNQPLADHMRLVRASALLEAMFLNSHYFPRTITAPHYLEEASTLFTQLGEVGRHGLAQTRFVQIQTFSILGERPILYEQLLPEFEALEDKFWMAECLAYMGYHAAYQNEFQLAETYWQRSLQISLEAGDWDIITWQKANLAKLAFDQGNLEKARDWAAQARQNLVEIETELPVSALVGHNTLGDLAWAMGDYANAEVNLKASIAIRERFYKDDSRWVKISLLWLSQGEYDKARNLLDDLFGSIQYKDDVFGIYVIGELEWGNGKYAQARQIFTEILQLPNLHHMPSLDHLYRIYSILGLAKVALSEEYWQEAALHLGLALELQNQMPFLDDEIYEDRYAGITLTAILALSQGRLVVAARLFGAGSSSYQRYRLTCPLYRRQFYEQAMDAAHAALNEEDFSKAWEEGKALDLRQALESALDYVKSIVETEGLPDSPVPSHKGSSHNKR